MNSNFSWDIGLASTEQVPELQQFAVEDFVGVEAKAKTSYGALEYLKEGVKMKEKR